MPIISMSYGIIIRLYLIELAVSGENTCKIAPL